MGVVGEGDNFGCNVEGCPSPQKMKRSLIYYTTRRESISTMGFLECYRNLVRARTYLGELSAEPWRP